jgi:hypothetical protein
LRTTRLAGSLATLRPWLRLDLQAFATPFLRLYVTPFLSMVCGVISNQIALGRIPAWREEDWERLAKGSSWPHELADMIACNSDDE